MKLIEMKRPNFKNPPVNEVVLSTEFDLLQKFRLFHIGQLYEKYKELGYEQFSEHEPIENTPLVLDPSELPMLSFNLAPNLPIQRIWFKHVDNEKLIQFQQNRFLFNWIKQEKPYPRYEDILNSFNEKYKILDNFLTEKRIGRINNTQCEIQYVNRITPSRIWCKHSDYHKIIEFFKMPRENDFLSKLNDPEGIDFRTSFLVSENDKQEDTPIGRLFLRYFSSFFQKQPVFVLDIKVVGTPPSNGLEGILKFFDIGREWIVKTFYSVTKQDIHKSDWEVL